LMTQFRCWRNDTEGYFDSSDLDLACAAVHSSLLNDTQPWPLQEFWPLQLFLAVEHSEVPLHEFTPVQCTLAVSAANDAVANPEVIIIAAAAAKAEPVNLFIGESRPLIDVVVGSHQRAAACRILDLPASEIVTWRRPMRQPPGDQTLAGKYFPALHPGGPRDRSG
jgi:hypothetical protein